MKRLLLSVLIVFSFYCNYLTAAGVLSGPAAGAGRAGGAAAAGAFSVGGASAPAAAPKTLTQAELRKKRASLRKAIVAGDEVELLDLLSHNYVLYRRYIFADKILKPTKVEETPIAMAIEACNRSALNALFEAHDPEFRSADGPTRATYYLCSLLRSENEFDLGLIRDLVEKYGADPKFEDPDGNNALGLLALRGCTGEDDLEQYKGMIQFFIEHEVSEKKKNKNGKSAVDLAAENRDLVFLRCVSDYLNAYVSKLDAQAKAKTRLWEAAFGPSAAAAAAAGGALAGAAPSPASGPVSMELSAEQLQEEYKKLIALIKADRSTEEAKKKHAIELTQFLSESQKRYGRYIFADTSVVGPAILAQNATAFCILADSNDPGLKNDASRGARMKIWLNLLFSRPDTDTCFSECLLILRKLQNRCGKAELRSAAPLDTIFTTLANKHCRPGDAHEEEAYNQIIMLLMMNLYMDFSNPEVAHACLRAAKEQAIKNENAVFVKCADTFLRPFTPDEVVASVFRLAAGPGAGTTESAAAAGVRLNKLAPDFFLGDVFKDPKFVLSADYINDLFTRNRDLKDGQDALGNNALAVLAERGCKKSETKEYEAILMLLLAKGFSAAKKNNAGESAVALAQRKGNNFFIRCCEERVKLVDEMAKRSSGPAARMVATLSRSAHLAAAAHAGAPWQDGIDAYIEGRDTTFLDRVRADLLVRDRSYSSETGVLKEVLDRADFCASGARKERWFALVKLLVQNSYGNLEESDKYGRLIIMKVPLDTMRELLTTFAQIHERAFSPNYQDANGDTALIKAARAVNNVGEKLLQELFGVLFCFPTINHELINDHGETASALLAKHKDDIMLSARLVDAMTNRDKALRARGYEDMNRLTALEVHDWLMQQLGELFLSKDGATESPKISPIAKTGPAAGMTVAAPKKSKTVLKEENKKKSEDDRRAAAEREKLREENRRKNEELKKIADARRKEKARERAEENAEQQKAREAQEAADRAEKAKKEAEKEARRAAREQQQRDQAAAREKERQDCLDRARAEQRKRQKDAMLVRNLERETRKNREQEEAEAKRKKKEEDDRQKTKEEEDRRKAEEARRAQREAPRKEGRLRYLEFIEVARNRAYAQGFSHFEDKYRREAVAEISSEEKLKRERLHEFARNIAGRACFTWKRPGLLGNFAEARDRRMLGINRSDRMEWDASKKNEWRSIFTPDPLTGNSKFMLACAEGRVSEVRYYLTKSFVPFLFKNKLTGNTAAHLAVLGGSRRNEHLLKGQKPYMQILALLRREWLRCVEAGQALQDPMLVKNSKHETALNLFVRSLPLDSYYPSIGALNKELDAILRG